MHLIFDFDGTLVDSIGNLVERINLLADEFDFQKVTPLEIARLKNLSSRELIKFLKIPFYKIPRIMYHSRKTMAAEMLSFPMFPDLNEVLKTLFHSKISLGILTSNSLENVTTWLTHHRIQHLFSFIEVESSYFGKNRMLKKIIKKYAMDKASTFYVGDETRDIDAANDSQIHSVAVTWGLNSEKVLLEHHPHFVIKRPQELLTLAL